jgi:N-methylhydantoinase A
VVAAAGLPLDRIDTLFELDMHYVGQTHTIAVKLTAAEDGGPAELTEAIVAEAFDTAYQMSFSRLLPGLGRRIVNLRTAAIGRRPAFDLLALAPAEHADPDLAKRGSRPVWFDGAWHDTAIYDRLALPAGYALAGPAVLEQPDATTIIDPGLTARVDRFGNVIVERMSV